MSLDLRLMADLRRLRDDNDALADELELWRDRAWLMADLYVDLVPLAPLPSQKNAA
jgi:hypothetical protein